MLNLRLITDFVDFVQLDKIVNDVKLEQQQIGKNIYFLEENTEPQDIVFDIAFIGINDLRGSELQASHHNVLNNIDVIRKHLYSLYNWHGSIKIVELGNLKPFATLQDTNNAISAVSAECIKNNTQLIVLGGPHNYVVGQYEGLRKQIAGINYTNIDTFIDINLEKQFEENNFLHNLFFNTKTSIVKYTHLAFQSYYTNPEILETLNNLNYECYRLGYVKDNTFEIEPQIRSSHLISFDIATIANSNALHSNLSNGFNGEEACLLLRFCGMSNALKTIGIYGYYSFLDKDEKMATLTAQMLWYFIEGVYYKNKEGNFETTNLYNTFFTTFNEIKTVFYQSKYTKRWWVEHHNEKKIIPCSYKDYLMISKNEIPDRWLKGFGINYNIYNNKRAD